MPLQTRRQAAAAATHEPGSQEEPSHRAEQEEETPNKRRSAQHRSTPGSASRAPPLPSGSPVHHYESPAAREAARAAASASRHMPESPSGRRAWHESSSRGHRHPPHHGGTPPEPLFSPPPFKTDRYHHPKREHPSHNIMDERTARDYDQLDLNEDIGPEMEDPLFPLSSFADESPPRADARSPEPAEPGSERKRPATATHPRRSPPPQPYSYSYSSSSQYRRTPSRSSGEYHSTPSSQGRTPMYQYGYHQSPPAGYGSRGSPRSNYYYGPSSYYNYHPEQQHWEAPYSRYPPGPPYYERDEDIIPPPPQSASKRPKEEAASPPRHRNETPEKEKPARSPFRSPPQSTSKARYRRSPMNPSPYIGGYGSWDMNTPSGTLAQEAFSPMGATFAGFDENTPLQLGDGSLNPKLSISHSGSNDSETPMGRRLRPKSGPQSPITGLLNDLSSPFEGGLVRGTPGSPGRHGSRYEDRMPGSRGPPSSRSKGSGAMSGGREGSRMPRTPVESVPKPRKLWPGEHPPPASTPGHVRMEIGGSGSSGTRKSFEGINSMMHPRHSSREPPHHAVSETPHHSSRGTPHHAGRETPSHHGEAYPSSAPPPPPPHHRGAPPPPPHHYPAMHYRSDMTTPIKPMGHHGHQPQRLTPPSGRHHHSYAPGSASKPTYTPTAPPKTEYQGSAQKPVFRATPSSESETPRQIPSSSGKENSSSKKKSPGKRSPCNCKRSKCLKLYCECFAAEKFCDGCNCTDCGNTPNAGMIREKAIKDTRAKNPNAFKPRIGVKPVVQGRSSHSGHNMGCRCKKSECLKKYCECFQAGVICGGKCKCVDCLNYAGSQALIDKRRKIKDQRGADFAMRVADEAWKGRVPHGAKKPPTPAGPPSSSRRPPSPGRMPPPAHHMTHPSPRGPPPPGTHPHPYYMPHYMPPPPAGHSPSMMGIPITPAGYPYPPPHMAPGDAPPHGMYHPPPHPVPHSASRKPGPARQSKAVTPGVASTPRTPAVRVFKFDPATSRKKRKLSPDGKEPTLPYFGEKAPQQPKTTALAIFSFLTNDDLFNAGLVCKSWSQLATDDELWKFEK